MHHDDIDLKLTTAPLTTRSWKLRHDNDVKLSIDRQTRLDTRGDGLIGLTEPLKTRSSETGLSTRESGLMLTESPRLSVRDAPVSMSVTQQGLMLDDRDLAIDRSQRPVQHYIARQKQNREEIEQEDYRTEQEIVSDMGDEDRAFWNEVGDGFRFAFQGFFEGFTTFRLGGHPDTTVEQLSYSMGNLLGFLGFAPIGAGIRGTLGAFKLGRKAIAASTNAAQRFTKGFAKAVKTPTKPKVTKPQPDPLDKFPELKRLSKDPEASRSVKQSIGSVASAEKKVRQSADELKHAHKVLEASTDKTVRSAAELVVKEATRKLGLAEKAVKETVEKVTKKLSDEAAEEVLIAARELPAFSRAVPELTFLQKIQKSQPIQEFKSVPFLVADSVKLGLKHAWDKKRLYSKLENFGDATGTRGAVNKFNMYMAEGRGVRDFMEQGIRIGTAFSASSWMDGPRAMMDSFLWGAAMGGFDKVLANATVLRRQALKGKLTVQPKVKDMLDLFTGKTVEEQLNAGRQFFRAMAGGMFNVGISYKFTENPPELLIYDFLLGFYFGGREISASQRRALQVIQKYNRSRTSDPPEKWLDTLWEWSGPGKIKVDRSPLKKHFNERVEIKKRLEEVKSDIAVIKELDPKSAEGIKKLPDLEKHVAQKKKLDRDLKANLKKARAYVKSLPADVVRKRPDRPVIPFDYETRIELENWIEQHKLQRALAFAFGDVSRLGESREGEFNELVASGKWSPRLEELLKKSGLATDEGIAELKKQGVKPSQDMIDTLALENIVRLDKELNPYDGDENWKIREHRGLEDAKKGDLEYAERLPGIEEAINNRRAREKAIESDKSIISKILDTIVGTLRDDIAGQRKPGERTLDEEEAEILSRRRSRIKALFEDPDTIALLKNLDESDLVTLDQAFRTLFDEYAVGRFEDLKKKGLLDRFKKSDIFTKDLEPGKEVTDDNVRYHLRKEAFRKITELADERWNVDSPRNTEVEYIQTLLNQLFGVAKDSKLQSSRTLMKEKDPQNIDAFRRLVAIREELQFKKRSILKELFSKVKDPQYIKSGLHLIRDATDSEITSSLKYMDDILNYMKRLIKKSEEGGFKLKHGDLPSARLLARQLSDDHTWSAESDIEALLNQLDKKLSESTDPNVINEIRSDISDVLKIRDVIIQKSIMDLFKEAMSEEAEARRKESMGEWSDTELIKIEIDELKELFQEMSDDWKVTRGPALLKAIKKKLSMLAEHKGAELNLRGKKKPSIPKRYRGTNFAKMLKAEERTLQAMKDDIALLENVTPHSYLKKAGVYEEGISDALKKKRRETARRRAKTRRDAIIKEEQERYVALGNDINDWTFMNMLKRKRAYMRKFAEDLGVRRKAVSHYILKDKLFTEYKGKKHLVEVELAKALEVIFERDFSFYKPEKMKKKHGKDQRLLLHSLEIDKLRTYGRMLRAHIELFLSRSEINSTLTEYQLGDIQYRIDKLRENLEGMRKALEENNYEIEWDPGAENVDGKMFLRWKVAEDSGKGRTYMYDLGEVEFVLNRITRIGERKYTGTYKRLWHMVGALRDARIEHGSHSKPVEAYRKYRSWLQDIQDSLKKGMFFGYKANDLTRTDLEKVLSVIAQAAHSPSKIIDPTFIGKLEAHIKEKIEEALVKRRKAIAEGKEIKMSRLEDSWSRAGEGYRNRSILRAEEGGWEAGPHSIIRNVIRDIEMHREVAERIMDASNVNVRDRVLSAEMQEVLFEARIEKVKGKIKYQEQKLADNEELAFLNDLNLNVNIVTLFKERKNLSVLGLSDEELRDQIDRAQKDLDVKWEMLQKFAEEIHAQARTQSFETHSYEGEIDYDEPFRTTPNDIDPPGGPSVKFDMDGGPDNVENDIDPPGGPSIKFDFGPENVDDDGPEKPKGPDTPEDDAMRGFEQAEKFMFNIDDLTNGELNRDDAEQAEKDPLVSGSASKDQEEIDNLARKERERQSEKDLEEELRRKREFVNRLYNAKLYKYKDIQVAHKLIRDMQFVVNSIKSRFAVHDVNTGKLFELLEKHITKSADIKQMLDHIYISKAPDRAAIRAQAELLKRFTDALSSVLKFVVNARAHMRTYPDTYRARLQAKRDKGEIVYVSDLESYYPDGDEQRRMIKEFIWELTKTLGPEGEIKDKHKFTKEFMDGMKGYFIQEVFTFELANYVIPHSDIDYRKLRQARKAAIDSGEQLPGPINKDIVSDLRKDFENNKKSKVSGLPSPKKPIDFNLINGLDDIRNVRIARTVDGRIANRIWWKHSGKEGLSRLGMAGIGALRGMAQLRGGKDPETGEPTYETVSIPEYMDRHLDLFTGIREKQWFLREIELSMFEDGYIIYGGVSDKEHFVFIDNPFKSHVEAEDTILLLLGSISKRIDEGGEKFAYMREIRDRILERKNQRVKLMDEARVKDSLDTREASDFEFSKEWKWWVASTAWNMEYELHMHDTMDFSTIWQGKEREIEGSFLSNQLKANKRKQITNQNHVPLSYMDMSDVEGFAERDNNHIRFVIVNDPDPRGPRSTDTDGVIIVREAVFDKIADTTGFGHDYGDEVGALKPFAAQPSHLGGLLLKASFQRAAPGHEKMMDEQGIDMIVYPSAAKQYGIRETFDMIEDPRTGEFLRFEQDGIEKERIYYELGVDSITVSKSVYDNPKKIGKGGKIPVQLTQALMFKDLKAIQALQSHLFEEGSILAGVEEENQKVNDLIESAKKGGDEWKELDRKLNINVDKLGISQLLGVLYQLNDRPTKVYGKVVTKIINAFRDPNNWADYDTEKKVKKNFSEFIEASDQEAGHFAWTRIASESGIVPADIVSKPMFQYLKKALRAYVLKSFTNPQYKHMGEAIMSYNTHAMGMAQRGGMRLGTGYKKLVVKWGKNKEQEIKLGDAWEEFQSAGGWDNIQKGKEWMLERMRMITMRTPASQATGIRSLRFDGWLPIQGKMVQFHHEDMAYQGGADLDIDKAFIIQGLPKEFVDAIESYRYYFNEDQDGDKKFIGDFGEKYDELFVVEPSSVYNTNTASMYSSTAGMLTALNASQGKLLLATGMGMSKKTLRYYEHRLERLAKLGLDFGHDTPDYMEVARKRKAEEDEATKLGQNVEPFDEDAVNHFNTELRRDQIVSIEKALSQRGLVSQNARFYWTVKTRTDNLFNVMHLSRQIVNYSADAANYSQIINKRQLGDLLTDSIFDLDTFDIRIYDGKKGESTSVRKLYKDNLMGDFAPERDSILKYMSGWETKDPVRRAMDYSITRGNKPMMKIYKEWREKGGKLKSRTTIGKRELSIHATAKRSHRKMKLMPKNVYPIDVYSTNRIANMQLPDGTLLRDASFITRRYADRIHSAGQISRDASSVFGAAFLHNLEMYDVEVGTYDQATNSALEEGQSAQSYSPEQSFQQKFFEAVRRRVNMVGGPREKAGVTNAEKRRSRESVARDELKIDSNMYRMNTEFKYEPEFMDDYNEGRTVDFTWNDVMDGVSGKLVYQHVQRLSDMASDEVKQGMAEMLEIDDPELAFITRVQLVAEDVRNIDLIRKQLSNYLGADFKKTIAKLSNILLRWETGKGNPRQAKSAIADLWHRRFNALFVHDAKTETLYWRGSQNQRAVTRKEIRDEFNWFTDGILNQSKGDEFSVEMMKMRQIYYLGTLYPQRVHIDVALKGVREDFDKAQTNFRARPGKHQRKAYMDAYFALKEAREEYYQTGFQIARIQEVKLNKEVVKAFQEGVRDMAKLSHYTLTSDQIQQWVSGVDVRDLKGLEEASELEHQLNTESPSIKTYSDQEYDGVVLESLTHEDFLKSRPDQLDLKELQDIIIEAIPAIYEKMKALETEVLSGYLFGEPLENYSRQSKEVLVRSVMDFKDSGIPNETEINIVGLYEKIQEIAMKELERSKAERDNSEAEQAVRDQMEGARLSNEELQEEATYDRSDNPYIITSPVKDNGVLSHYNSTRPIVINNLLFRSLHHALLAMRFPESPGVQRQISEAVSIRQANEIAKRRASTSGKLDFDKVEPDVIRFLLRVQLAQHYDTFSKEITDTGDKEIILWRHAKVKDPFVLHLGAKNEGFTVKGSNIYGKLLMELRSEIQLHHDNKTTAGLLYADPTGLDATMKMDGRHLYRIFGSDIDPERIRLAAEQRYRKDHKIKVDVEPYPDLVKYHNRVPSALETDRDRIATLLLTRGWTLGRKGGKSLTPEQWKELLDYLNEKGWSPGDLITEMWEETTLKRDMAEQDILIRELNKEAKPLDDKLKWRKKAIPWLEGRTDLSQKEVEKLRKYKKEVPELQSQLDEINLKKQPYELKKQALKLELEGRNIDHENRVLFKMLADFKSPILLRKQINNLLKEVDKLDTYLRKQNETYEGHFRITSVFDADYSYNLRSKRGDHSPSVVLTVGRKALMDMGGVLVEGNAKYPQYQDGEAAIGYGRAIAQQNRVLIVRDPTGIAESALKGTLSEGGAAVIVTRGNFKYLYKKYGDYIKEGKLLLVSTAKPGMGKAVNPAVHANTYYSLADIAILIDGGSKQPSRMMGYGYVRTHVHKSVNKKSTKDYKVLVDKGAVPIKVEPLKIVLDDMGAPASKKLFADDNELERLQFIELHERHRRRVRQELLPRNQLRKEQLEKRVGEMREAEQARQKKIREFFERIKENQKRYEEARDLIILHDPKLWQVFSDLRDLTRRRPEFRVNFKEKVLGTLSLLYGQDVVIPSYRNMKARDLEMVLEVWTTLDKFGVHFSYQNLLPKQKKIMAYMFPEHIGQNLAKFDLKWVDHQVVTATWNGNTVLQDVYLPMSSMGILYKIQEAMSTTISSEGNNWRQDSIQLSKKIDNMLGFEKHFKPLIWHIALLQKRLNDKERYLKQQGWLEEKPAEKVEETVEQSEKDKEREKRRLNKMGLYGENIVYVDPEAQSVRDKINAEKDRLADEKEAKKDKKEAKEKEEDEAKVKWDKPRYTEEEWAVKQKEAKEKARRKKARRGSNFHYDKKTKKWVYKKKKPWKPPEKVDKVEAEKDPTQVKYENDQKEAALAIYRQFQADLENGWHKLKDSGFDMAKEYSYGDKVYKGKHVIFPIYDGITAMIRRGLSDKKGRRHIVKFKNGLMNPTKTLEKIYKYVRTYDRFPELSERVIQELRTEIRLGEQEVNPDNLPEIQKLKKKGYISRRKIGKRRLHSITDSRVYKIARDFLADKLHIRENTFDLDPETFFPYHGHTEPDKMAHIRHVIENHRKHTHKGKERLDANGEPVRDVVIGNKFFKQLLNGIQDVGKENHYNNSMHSADLNIDPFFANKFAHNLRPIFGYKMDQAVIPNYLESVTRSKYKQLSSMLGIYEINQFRARHMALSARKKYGLRGLSRKRTMAWTNYMRLYLAQSLGKPSIIPDLWEQNEEFNISRLSKALKDTMWIKRIDAKMNGIRKDIKVSEHDRATQSEQAFTDKQYHLLYKGFSRIQQLTRLRLFSEIEARYELKSLLYHPKVWVGNMMGGTVNTIVRVGLKNYLRTFDKKWIAEHIGPELSTFEGMEQFAKRGGMAESELTQELGVTDLKNQGYRANLRWRLSLKGYISKSDIVEVATQSRQSEWLVRRAAFFIQHSENKLRVRAWMAHHIHAREVMNYNRLAHDINEPYLYKMANGGVRATQYVYDNYNRPDFMASNLGKVFGRFKLWVLRSVSLSRDIWRTAEAYNFEPGSYGHQQMNRYLVAMLFIQMLAELYPFSLFESTVPAPLDQLANAASLLFGDEDDQDRSFYGYGEYGPVGIAWSQVKPPIARIPESVFASLLTGEWRRFADYHLWNMMPFGRSARSIMKASEQPSEVLKEAAGIPNLMELFEGWGAADKEPITAEEVNQAVTSLYYDPDSPAYYGSGQPQSSRQN